MKSWLVPLIGSFTKIRTSSKIIRNYLVGKSIKIPFKWGVNQLSWVRDMELPLRPFMCHKMGLSLIQKLYPKLHGGVLYYEMHHMPPKRFPFFKPALTQKWPLGLCVATHRPPIFCHSKTPNFWFVTQRPPIFDFATQEPIISIWSKLWLVTITERPHNLWSVT